jgi:hypothetical protein
MRQGRRRHEGTRRRHGRRVVVTVATVGIVAAGATVAGAEITKDNDRRLAAVGPVGAHGFPVWYEDHSGLRLEQCLDAADAYCDPAFLTAEGLDPAQPLHIGRGPADSNWPGESFYYAANNSFDLPDGTQVDFVSALEATFANEEVADGDQVTFGRLRIRLEDAQPGGTYTITHPYGLDTLTADADGEIRYVQDKTPAPDDFGLALDSRIAPFLVDADGLHETPTGNYVGQPGVETTVTGSTYGTDYVEISGPGLTTPFRDDTFDLMGKVATNSGIVPVAAHRIDHAGTAQDFLDVYATAGPNDAVQVRGEGIPLTTLAGTGSDYYARIPVAADTFPSTVTVINASDDPVAEMSLPVTANVAVTSATAGEAVQQTAVVAGTTAAVGGEAVTLDGSSSANATGFRWAQTAGTPVLAGVDTTAPSIAFAAPAEAGTLTFVLTTTGPLGTRTATHSVAVSAPAVVDETAITVGQLRTTTREWRVDGTSTVPARNTVTVYLTRADGTGRELVGAAQVGATGTWSVQVAGVLPPTGFTRLVAESSQGGVSPLFAYASRR